VIRLNLKPVRQAIENAIEAEFRQTGYTAAALNYPLSDAGFRSLCAYNGIQPEKAPRTWRYSPNAEVQCAREAAAMTAQQEG
jgi:hypothetical protein